MVVCRYCILFPEQPAREEGLGSGHSRAGVLVLTPYKSSYSKALGKDGVLVLHNNSVMHNRASEKAASFLHNFSNPAERVDCQLAKQGDQLADKNKHILSLIVLAIKFLAKQGLPFRGHRDDKVDFSSEGMKRGNFIATLQFLAKTDPILNKRLVSDKKNAKYTSKTIQNEIVSIYAKKL